MHKTYLSVAVSRAWDGPIGDPFGGPAYGERNMPMVAIAAAVSAASTIATVGIAAMSAFQIVSAVGAIAAGIGAITGNEKLTKIGGVIGAVGSLGSFAQSQGWLGGEAAKSATEQATSAATQNAQAAKVAEQAGGNVADVARGGADVASQIEAASSSVAQPAADSTGLLGSQRMQTTGDLGRFDSMAGPASAGSPAAQMPAVTASSPSVGASLPNAQSSAGGLPGTAKTGGFLDTFKSFGKFLEENKTLATLGGAAIGGMFDKEKEAKEEAYRAQTDILRQQQANMANIPYARTTQPRPSVFRPGAQTYTPVGLLNASRR